MKFVNLTPHAIALISSTSKGVSQTHQDSQTKLLLASLEDIVIIKEFPPTNLPLPRIKMRRERREYIEGIPIVSGFGENEIENLPEPEEGTFFIVSSLVAGEANLLGRSDILAPNELVRDKNNPSTILGAMSLRRTVAQ